MDFSHPKFLSSWTRRTYTHEKNLNVNLLSLGDTRAARENASGRLRYGNNMTILLRACCRLGSFYDSPGFWPAVSCGFSTGPRNTQDMVEHLVRARRIYRHHSWHRDFRSGATHAVDKWITFIDKYEAGSSSWRPNLANIPDSDQAAYRTAMDYYEQTKTAFLQDDAAWMLSERGIEDVQRSIQEARRAGRKRPPSPSPLQRPREAKRVFSSDRPEGPAATTIDHRSPPAKANPPLKPPLALDTNRPEQQAKRKAKQEYPTPTSIVERPQPEEYASLPQAPPVENFGARIRGIAQQGSRSPPPDNSQPVPESQPTSQVQVKKQGATDVQHESSDPIKDAPGTLKAPSNISTTETPEPGLVTTMRYQIAVLEKQLLEAEAARKKDAASDKALIAAFETRMVELEQSRSAAAVLMQKMQAELALMQSKSVVPPDNCQPAASVDSTLEANQKEMLKLDERLTALEEEGITVRRALGGMDQANRNGLSPTPPEDILRSVDDMQKRVKALPTMHHVADKVFQLEKKLRESLQTYQRNNEERMDQMSLDLENMRAQTRGLVKQFDKATACLPKTATLKATQEEVARLKAEVRTKTDALEKKGDTQAADLASLSDRVGDLSSKTDSLGQKVADTQLQQQALDSLQASVASLSGRGEEMASKIDVLVQEMEDRRAESDVLRRTLSQLLSQLHQTRLRRTDTDQASPAGSHSSNGTPNVPPTGPPSNSTVRVSAPAGFQIRPGGPRGP